MKILAEKNIDKLRCYKDRIDDNNPKSINLTEESEDEKKNCDCEEEDHRVRL